MFALLGLIFQADFSFAVRISRLKESLDMTFGVTLYRGGTIMSRQS